jgi:hypothetical protein
MDLDIVVPILDRTHRSLGKTSLHRHFADSVEGYHDLIGVTGAHEAQLTVLHIARGMQNAETSSMINATIEKFGSIPIVVCYDADDPRAVHPPNLGFDDHVYQVKDGEEEPLVKKLLAA